MEIEPTRSAWTDTTPPDPEVVELTWRRLQADLESGQGVNGQWSWWTYLNF